MLGAILTLPQFKYSGIIYSFEVG